MRALVAETALEPRHFIAPFFVIPGRDAEEPIGSLPGVSRLSVDKLLRELERALHLGVRSAVLFGVVPADVKSSDGRGGKRPARPRAHSAVRGEASVWRRP